jgi:hypothetical protein
MVFQYNFVIYFLKNIINICKFFRNPYLQNSNLKTEFIRILLYINKKK